MKKQEKVKHFKELIVWQKAMLLAKNAYLLTKMFPKHELFGLTQQIRRAAVSIPANIAEGQARNGRKEFIHFLGIASGSLAELQTHLMLAEMLEYAGEKELGPLHFDTNEVGRIIGGLLHSLTADH